ncbi:hypothetical protein MMC11_007046 [Xylographa trunciseda]|nr:hypothetical protein [Xylographa trunciseda]
MDQEEVLADLEKHRLQAEFSSESTLQTVSSLDGGGVTKQTWKRARPLGFGTFGQVWQEAMESEYGDWHYRAVKVCSRAQMRRVGVDYRRELDAFAKLSTSQYSGLFVLFNGWWMDPQNVYLAMEYLGRGDLSKYIIMGLDEIEAREVMENITHGLRVMHQEGFTHRDIKPQVTMLSKAFIAPGAYPITAEHPRGPETA